MKTSFIKIVILSILITIGISGCSKKEYDPDDYSTSILSGEYSKGGIWKLYVTVNGESIENYDYVRFESKDLSTGDFKFVNVIPEESRMDFVDIPLTITEKGISFNISYTSSNQEILISGLIDLGEMSLNIEMR